MKQRPRVKSGYHRLPGNTVTKCGDRVVYADGGVGGEIVKNEIGMKAASTGYAGVARKTRR